MAERWSARRWLNAHPEVKLRRDGLGLVRGLYGTRGRRAVIVVHEELDRRSWRAVIAHEAHHHERGGGAEYDGQPATWGPVVERDERRCDNGAAGWLIPADELAAWLTVRADDPTTVVDVAEHFDVPLWIAERAVHMIGGR
jgi:hypothetical protein